MGPNLEAVSWWLCFILVLSGDLPHPLWTCRFHFFSLSLSLSLSFFLPLFILLLLLFLFDSSASYGCSGSWFNSCSVPVWRPPPSAFGQRDTNHSIYYLLLLSLLLFLLSLGFFWSGCFSVCLLDAFIKEYIYIFLFMYACIYTFFYCLIFFWVVRSCRFIGRKSWGSICRCRFDWMLAPAHRNAVIPPIWKNQLTNKNA